MSEYVQTYTKEQSRHIERLAFITNREKYLDSLIKPDHDFMWREGASLWEGRVTLPITTWRNLLESARLRSILGAIESGDPVEKKAFDEDWKELMGNKVAPFDAKNLPWICPNEHTMKRRFDEKSQLLYYYCTDCKPPFIRWKKDL